MTYTIASRHSHVSLEGAVARCFRCLALALAVKVGCLESAEGSSTPPGTLPRFLYLVVV